MNDGMYARRAFLVGLSALLTCVGTGSAAAAFS